MRRLLRFFLWISIASLVSCALVVTIIDLRTRKRIYSLNAATHPAQAVLIPGASVLANKTPSNTLVNRLRAGIDLYHNEIVPKIILSGDDRKKSYNEVSVMLDYCLRHGVRPEDIFLDHAGIRTFDSVRRAKEVFGVETVVIVSQNLYLPRALLIADRFKLKSEGVIAESSAFDETFFAHIREYLARLKSIVDILFYKNTQVNNEKLSIHGDGRKSWPKND